MSEEQTSFLVLFHAFETVFTPSIIFVNFRAFEFPTERLQSHTCMISRLCNVPMNCSLFKRRINGCFSFPQSSLWLFSLISFLSFFGFCFAFRFRFFYYSLYLVQLSLLRLYYNKIYDKLAKRDFK